MVFFYFFFRHKILDMLTKNPPFTKNMESPLCNEALVDQLWKLMNSGWFLDWLVGCLGFFEISVKDLLQNIQVVS